MGAKGESGESQARTDNKIKEWNKPGCNGSFEPVWHAVWHTHITPI